MSVDTSAACPEGGVDSDLLQAFMKGFYGYGSYEAPYWFVGIEESGGNSVGDIVRRLRAWDGRQRPEIDDLQGFHSSAEIEISLTKPQRTWRPLIQFVLRCKDESVSKESVCEYQASRLGREGGETCLLELLPLPRPGARAWPYSSWSTLPAVTTYRAYEKAVRAARTETILSRIRQYCPSVVVFYGKSDFWRNTVSIDAAAGGWGFDAGKIAKTAVFVTAHPCARSNDASTRFDAIADRALKLLRSE